MRGARGFTLMEVLVALAVLGSALAVMYRLYGGVVDAAVRAGQAEAGLELARNGMVLLQSDPRAVGEGETQIGRVRYHWRRRAEAVERRTAPLLGREVSLLRLVVEVEWEGQGRLALRSYRVVLP